MRRVRLPVGALWVGGMVSPGFLCVSALSVHTVAQGVTAMLYPLIQASYLNSHDKTGYHAPTLTNPILSGRVSSYINRHKQLNENRGGFGKKEDIEQH